MEPVDESTDVQADVETEVEEGAIDWFVKAGTDAANDKLLHEVDEVVHGRQDFKQKFRGFLKVKNGDKKIPTTKAELEQQIADYDGDYASIRQMATSALSHATGARATYKHERQTGGKKVGRIAQHFVKTFADFLHAYSGIIELLRGAGQVYGDVAYETLSILFIVVVNKSGNDSKIGGLLLDLRRSFPQLDDWTKIYPSLSMKTLVTEVYKQIIEFARQASVYFTQFSTRFWMAIGKPPSMGIDKTATQVHKKLAEVSSEAMFQLHKRSQNIHVTVEDSHARIKHLERNNRVLVHAYENLLTEYKKFRAQVELEQENQDKQRLEAFREMLQITYPSPSTTLSTCATTLHNAFHSTSSPRKNSYQLLTPALLNTLPAYTTWCSPTSSTAPHSSLLVLGGKTAPEARTSRGFTHSWLSPAALYVVESVRAKDSKENGNDKGKVAFYCCHPGVRAESSIGTATAPDGHSGRDVVANLVFQILEWQPKVLRRKMAQFKAQLKGVGWQDGKGGNVNEEDEHRYGHWRVQEKEVVRTWFTLLREVLVEVKEEGLVHLVLDRVDLVEGCALRYFMAELVDLVRDERCLVKALVVINTARGVWDAEGMEEDGKVMVLQDLDQKRVGVSKLLHTQSY